MTIEHKTILAYWHPASEQLICGECKEKANISKPLDPVYVSLDLKCGHCRGYLGTELDHE